MKPGDSLGRYRIVSELGVGGMGVVYQAEDTRLGRAVALKFLSTHLAQDDLALDRFRREARAASALNHPYICTIYDIGEADGQPFIAMELLEGESLRRRLWRSRLAVAGIVDAAVQLADALEAAHAKGIVHRDIKPENIFITTRGAAKLLDFGIATLAAGQAAVTGAITVARAGTGPVVLGTVAYMSPEQVRGEPLDARSDLFSLGAVVYEMATGTQPFRGTTSAAVLGEILTKAPTAPVRLNLDVPADLERIVNKLLEKDRDLRYQSARDVRVDLERLRRTLTEPATAGRAPAVGPHGLAAFSAEVLPSVAVLPFVNMSGDKEQEYFSDGMAEEVINVLSRIAGLKVIARTSAFAFKNRQEDVRTIAGTLGVTNILEGSVRKAGNRVRITAQLITATDGSHLWSERYDRDLTDIFAIQDEIAAAIAGALQVKLSVLAPCPARRVANPEAYDWYLKALNLLWKLTPEALANCRECLEHAIAIDPGFALARFGLAQHAWILASMGYLPAHEAMPVVRTEARQSLALDPGLADAHAMLGVVAAAYDYDWEEAERRFLTAVSYRSGPAKRTFLIRVLLSSADWPHTRRRCSRQTGACRRSAEHIDASLLWNLSQRGRQACGGPGRSTTGSGHRGQSDVRLRDRRLRRGAAREVGGCPRSRRESVSPRHAGERATGRHPQSHGGTSAGGRHRSGSDERPVLRRSAGPGVVLRNRRRHGQVGRVVRKGGGATPSGRRPSLVPRVADHIPMARAGEADEPPSHSPRRSRRVTSSASRRRVRRSTVRSSTCIVSTTARSRSAGPTGNRCGPLPRDSRPSRGSSSHSEPVSLPRTPSAARPRLPSRAVVVDSKTRLPSPVVRAASPVPADHRVRRDHPCRHGHRPPHRSAMMTGRFEFPVGTRMRSHLSLGDW